MFKPETAFTDADVDKLLSETPLSALGSILITKPFKGPSYSMGSDVFNDYHRLIRMASSECLKRLIRNNPQMANDMFGSICEHARNPTHEYNDFQRTRITLIDWIIDERIMNVNTMLEYLVEYRHVPQMNRIIEDPHITDSS